MHLKRTGSVWVLVFLITICFIRTLATPEGYTKENGTRRGSFEPRGNRTPANHTAKNATSNKESPSELSTPQVEKEDTNETKKNNEETVAPSEGLSKHTSDSGEEPASIKDGEFLYFEIRKCISERNLSINDIQEVLSQKDDEDQFMYTLADKLGYLANGKHDDPHILVIKSHKEKLIVLLEMKKTPSLQENFKQEPAESDASPVSKLPAADSNTHKVGFNVSKEIQLLGAKAIESLINDYSLSGVLGYAVGKELGYSDNDERIAYLENAKENELKDLLRGILKSKISKDSLSTSDDGEDQRQKTSGERGLNRTGTTSQGIDQDDERHNDYEPSRPEENGDPKNDIQGQTHHNSDLTDTEVPRGSKKTENPVEGGGTDGNKQNRPLKQKPEEDGETMPSTSEDDEYHEASKVIQTNENPSPKEGDVRNSESEDGNLEGTESKDLPENGPDYDYNGDSGLFLGIDEERMRLLKSDGFWKFLASSDPHLYEEFRNNRADQDDIYIVLENYIDRKSGKSEHIEREKGGGSDSNMDTKPEAKGGETVCKIHLQHAVGVPRYLRYLGIMWGLNMPSCG